MRPKRVFIVGFLLLVAVALVSACTTSEPTQEVEDTGDETYTSEVLDTAYNGALSVRNQLVLGTMLLEETEHAVTSGQAVTLLPLWRALQSGAVTAEAEVSAVLKQIEGQMEQDQLEAIAAMQLTQEDMQAWLQEQGVGAGGGFPGGGGDPDARATRRAELAEMTDEEREALRATAQASGNFPGAGGGEMPPAMATRRAQLESMTDEEREALRATAQAGGVGGRGGGSGSGQLRVLLNPLIELLEARAEEG